MFNMTIPLFVGLHPGVHTPLAVALTHRCRRRGRSHRPGRWDCTRESARRRPRRAAAGGDPGRRRRPSLLRRAPAVAAANVPHAMLHL